MDPEFSNQSVEAGVARLLGVIPTRTKLQIMLFSQSQPFSFQHFYSLVFTAIERKGDSSSISPQDPSLQVKLSIEGVLNVVLLLNLVTNEDAEALTGEGEWCNLIV